MNKSLRGHHHVVIGSGVSEISSRAFYEWDLMIESIVTSIGTYAYVYFL